MRAVRVVQLRDFLCAFGDPVAMGGHRSAELIGKAFRVALAKVSN